jgi:hypothetical protein
MQRPNIRVTKNQMFVDITSNALFLGTGGRTRSKNQTSNNKVYIESGKWTKTNVEVVKELSFYVLSMVVCNQ